MGNDIDVDYSRNETRAHVRWIDKTHYMVLSTGEIREVTGIPSNDPHLSKSRQAYLLRLFRELRRMILFNCMDSPGRLLTVTLTYEENMVDKDQLYHDFEKFWKRLKYYLNQRGHQVEYITVAEPQGRGAWHMHMIVKSDRYLYIAAPVLEDIWGLGDCSTKRLKDVDGAVGDLCQYVSPRRFAASEHEAKKSDRLRHYPAGFNFYRNSRGMQKPPGEGRFWGELDRTFDFAGSEFTGMSIIDENHRIVNNICHIAGHLIHSECS